MDKESQGRSASLYFKEIDRFATISESQLEQHKIPCNSVKASKWAITNLSD